LEKLMLWGNYFETDGAAAFHQLAQMPESEGRVFDFTTYEVDGVAMVAAAADEVPSK